MPTKAHSKILPPRAKDAARTPLSATAVDNFSCGRPLFDSISSDLLPPMLSLEAQGGIIDADDPPGAVA
jgi:hypothetical protein